MSTKNPSRFPNPLIYAEYGKTPNDKDQKILLKDFIWDDPIFGEVKVPKGFIFDGASIPTIAWTSLGLHPFSSEVVKAGLVHDYLYSTKILQRKDADEVLKRILKYENDLSAVTISIIYGAVRIAGSNAYNNIQDESEYLRPDEVEQFIK